MDSLAKSVLINKLLRLVAAGRVSREQMDAFCYKRVLQREPTSHLCHCLPGSDDPSVDPVEVAAQHVERELELLKQEDEEKKKAAPSKAGGKS